MSRLRLLPATTVLLLAGLQTVSAQVEYEKVLLPIVVYNLPGAFGSVWQSELAIRNEADHSVRPFGYQQDCFLPECPPDQRPPLRPGTTIHPLVGSPPGFQSAFLFVEKAFAESIGFGLRFRDLTRQAQTWGTEVPVVREADFRGDYVSLLGIPTSAGFRQVLRIYELNGAEPRDARVRIRMFRADPENVKAEGSLPPDLFLGEKELELHFPPAEVFRPSYPAFLAVSDMSFIGPLPDTSRVSLRIEPISPGLKLWAFVTVVNNDTQHATVITPQ